jgi:prepilin signal peptidase PulO-like enzyme (type II secretory pathway)
MPRIVVFFAFSFLISVIDAKTYRIPDLLLMFFLGTMIVFDLEKGSLFHIERTLTGTVCFLVFLFIYRFTGGLGYGDVKYAAVLGYSLGAEAACYAFFFAAISGAAIYLLGASVFRWDKQTRLPFAPLLGMCSAFIGTGGAVNGW